MHSRLSFQHTRTTVMTDDTSLFSTPNTSFLATRGPAPIEHTLAKAAAPRVPGALELVANERRNFMLAAQAVCCHGYAQVE